MINLLFVLFLEEEKNKNWIIIFSQIIEYKYIFKNINEIQ